MRNQRGYSLVELMAALLILSLVITVTLLAFVERTRRMKQASNLIRAYQSLANEAEHVRRLQFDAIETSTFFTDTDVLAPLKPDSADVEVVQPALNRKNVTLVIRWHEGKWQKEARLGLIRTRTGGQNLW